MLRDMLEKRGIRMKEVTKQAEETQISHKTLRLMIGTLCSVIGTLLALYVGGWLMLCKPIQGVVSAYFAGNLTIGIIALAVFKCLLSVTVAAVSYTHLATIIRLLIIAEQTADQPALMWNLPQKPSTEWAIRLNLSPSTGKIKKSFCRMAVSTVPGAVLVWTDEWMNTNGRALI